MTKPTENIDVVVLSSTGIVRALVSAGLSIPHAKAAARLFMPHLQAQEQAEDCARKQPKRPRSSGKQIARKRASAMLSILDKELDRLCQHASDAEQAQRARRGSGLAILHVLRTEYQAQNRGSRNVPRLLLSPTMRVPEPDS